MNHLKIYDNGGVSIDRYTVLKMNVKPRIEKGLPYYPAISLSPEPLSSTGVCQYIEAVPGAHLGKIITFKALPKDCQIVLRS